MAITININGLTLCHKGSGGISHNTLPNVCKTPPFGTPIPYENEAYSADLVKGTTSVSADGGNMIAIVGSQFARSVFDEPGAMGGIISGTNMAETDWISHSFDVFFEKKPACRLTDKLFMNHRNTVNMAGLCQNPLKENVLESKICDAICKCRNRVAREFRQKIKMFTEAPAIGLAQELLGRFLGVNSELPKTGDKVKTGPRQKCFAQQFNQSGQSDTWAGATPQDPCYLTEVPYIIDKSKLIQNRADGRSTFPGGPQAPASVKYAVRDVARHLGKGKIVIWDLVVLKNSALSARWKNIEQIIEIKFDGDILTKNQEEALKTKMSEKVRIINENKCHCDDKDEEEKEKALHKVENFLRQLNDSARKTFGTAPGGFGTPFPIPSLF
ncbi:DUF4150 domain-containing protein [Salmonella bongori]|uniref:DUF4150 domain-containing protein n=1 Tax=Salmonella bongori TaxID=54736 RepID=UPI0020A6C821|nr:DUF4150 domain-containing protein [Salmonella bongori]